MMRKGVLLRTHELLPTHLHTIECHALYVIVLLYNWQGGRCVQISTTTHMQQFALFLYWSVIEHRLRAKAGTRVTHWILQGQSWTTDSLLVFLRPPLHSEPQYSFLPLFFTGLRPSPWAEGFLLLAQSLPLHPSPERYPSITNMTNSVLPSLYPWLLRMPNLLN